MKFLLISPKNRTVYNFRGDLIKAIIAQGYEVIVTGPDRTDVDKIEALGARFVEIPMNKTGTSVTGDLKYRKALKELMLAERPNATLGYTIKPVIYGALAAHAAGVKNVNGMITGGGYTFTAKTAKAKLLGTIVRFLYRLGLKRTNHIIFQNPDDLEEFCSHDLAQKEKSCVVHGSGVNMEQFAPAPLPDKPVFFMLSRLLKSKGVMVYLEAARIVKTAYPEAQFFLLGKYETAMQDAIPRETIEAFLRDGIVERFEETTDVRPYYARCSVYVLPSYREGTPRTVLEAMSMGRPIITADANGCRETVRDGVNGYLVPVGDSAALAERMKAFILHPEKISEMGAASVRLCREMFEVGKVNEEMLRIMKL